MGNNGQPFALPVLDGFAVPDGERLDVSAGGLLVGPGTETSDEIATTMPGGCFILNAAAVKAVGRETLDALVALSHGLQVNGWFSPGEYVVPPRAVAVLGRHFWHSLNDAGRILLRGHFLDPAEHVCAVQAVAAKMLRDLEILMNQSEGWQALLEPAMCEDSRSMPAAECGILQELQRV